VFSLVVALKPDANQAFFCLLAGLGHGLFLAKVIY